MPAWDAAGNTSSQPPNLSRCSTLIYEEDNSGSRYCYEKNDASAFQASFLKNFGSHYALKEPEFEDIKLDTRLAEPVSTLQKRISRAVINGWACKINPTTPTTCFRFFRLLHL
jgi:hypothetical protein